MKVGIYWQYTNFGPGASGIYQYTNFQTLRATAGCIPIHQWIDICQYTNIPIYQLPRICQKIYTIYQLLNLRVARQPPFKGKRRGNGFIRLKPRLVYIVWANIPKLNTPRYTCIPYKHACPGAPTASTVTRGRNCCCCCCSSRLCWPGPQAGHTSVSASGRI